MAYQTTELSWHEGELAMHHLMHAPTNPNPTSPFLTPNGAYHIRQSPLQAVGILDKNGRPWTTIWAGEAGFSTPVSIGMEKGNSTGGFVVQCPVDAIYDPVINAIKENVARKEKSIVSGLGINLMKRDRVKWAGHVLGADFKDFTADDDNDAKVTMQAVVGVDSSLLNCPKYLNKIPLKVALPSPKLHSESTTVSPAAFPQEAISLIAAAPLCFLTASHNGATLSTNHRGGSPGFLRLALPDQLSPEARESLPISTDKPILVLPEYSGNRLYQTLGNLHETPYVGIAIPDFRNGDILYATAFVRILAGGDSARFMPHTNLCVAMELLEWRLVQHALGARFAGETPEDWGEDIDWSPYNPPIRHLAVEQRAYGLPTPPPDSTDGGMAIATLVGKTDLNMGIARFAFELAPTRGSGIPKWTAGQYVVLDFNSEIGQGYSHMRDDDPTSLNDDLIRTFTVSSVPNSSTFEITIRNVGRCTDFLFHANVRAGLEFPIIAFGGDFIISSGSDERSQEERAAPADTVGFVAGGIGITPLLAQMPGLRQVGHGVRVWWGVRAAEMAFVQKVMNGWKLEDTQATSIQPGRPSRGELDVRLFVSGLDTAASDMQQIAGELEGRSVQVERRRLQQQDLSGANVRDMGVVYLCAGKAMTQAVDGWLASESKTVVTESFNF